MQIEDDCACVEASYEIVVPKFDSFMVNQGHYRLLKLSMCVSGYVMGPILLSCFFMLMTC